MIRHDAIVLRNQLDVLTTKTYIKIYNATPSEVMEGKLQPDYEGYAYLAQEKLWEELNFVVNKIIPGNKENTATHIFISER